MQIRACERNRGGRRSRTSPNWPRKNVSKCSRVDHEVFFLSRNNSSTLSFSLPEESEEEENLAISSRVGTPSFHGARERRGESRLLPLATREERKREESGGKAKRWNCRVRLLLLFLSSPSFFLLTQKKQPAGTKEQQPWAPARPSRGSAAQEAPLLQPLLPRSLTVLGGHPLPGSHLVFPCSPPPMHKNVIFFTLYFLTILITQTG